MKGRSEEYLNGFGEGMGTDPVIGELQQVSKACVVEGLLSSFKLVPECPAIRTQRIRSVCVYVGAALPPLTKSDRRC